MNKNKAEYYLLKEFLEKVEWAIKGDCDDVDCDHYIYKSYLKKKHKTTLTHNFSCMGHLKRNKDILLRLLSMKRFRKLRYKKCSICKKQLDKLSEKSVIVGFIKPVQFKGKKMYQWKGKWVHRKCRRKTKISKSWKAWP